jgi:hypothetical protein
MPCLLEVLEKSGKAGQAGFKALLIMYRFDVGLHKAPDLIPGRLIE